MAHYWPFTSLKYETSEILNYYVLYYLKRGMCKYYYSSPDYLTPSGPTECQDGVTNNCTQTCSRNVSQNGTSSYECGCSEGYLLNEDGAICDGNSNVKLIVFIIP